MPEQIPTTEQVQNEVYPTQTNDTSSSKLPITVRVLLQSFLVSLALTVVLTYLTYLIAFLLFGATSSSPFIANFLKELPQRSPYLLTILTYITPPLFINLFLLYLFYKVKKAHLISPSIFGPPVLIYFGWIVYAVTRETGGLAGIGIGYVVTISLISSMVVVICSLIFRKILTLIESNKEALRILITGVASLLILIAFMTAFQFWANATQEAALEKTVEFSQQETLDRISSSSESEYLSIPKDETSIFRNGESAYDVFNPQEGRIHQWFDENRILFIKYPNAWERSKASYWVKDLSSKKEIQLTSEVSASGSIISPNKSKLVFLDTQTPYSQLHVVNLDGSGWVVFKIELCKDVGDNFCGRMRTDNDSVYLPVINETTGEVKFFKIRIT